MGAAVRALFYLRITSLQNLVISRFKRLKEPKYLIGAVVGAAYVYFVVLRRMRTNQGMGPGPLPGAFPGEQVPSIVSLGAVLVMIFVALYWLWPRERAALTFSEAEVAFLFPAPISRRALIHYRSINAQLRILFTSLILTLVSSGWSFLPGGAAIRILGWWMILSTLDLHGVGSSFVITRLLDRGVTSLRRLLLTLLIAATVVAVAALAAWRTLPAPTGADLVNLKTVANYVAGLLSAGPLSWLLRPAEWVIQPLLAPDLRSFLLALGPALLVFAAHYVWVLRAEVSFEEASIAKAEKRTARRSAARAGTLRIGSGTRKARRDPFKLASARRPELAFLWKNLLASAEYLRLRTALIAAAIIVIGCNWLTRSDFDVFRTAVAAFAGIGAGYTLFFAPLLARQDLRLDLPNTDLLKTYPLRGWQIVLGEMLTPVAIVTTLLWLMLLTAVLTAPSQPAGSLTPGVWTVAIIGIALLTPLLCTVQILLMNAAVVLFPAWIPTGANRASGIDVLGQRIVFIAALYLVVVVALLPATIGGAIAYFASLWIVGIGAVAAGFAVGFVLAILGAEIVFGIWWVGQRFEKFDLSSELRP